MFKHMTQKVCKTHQPESVEEAQCPEIWEELPMEPVPARLGCGQAQLNRAGNNDKDYVIRYFSDTYLNLLFNSWCLQTEPCTAPEQVKWGVWTGASQIENKCPVTGNMLKRNLNSAITFPINPKQRKHHLSKIVQAHQVFCLFFFAIVIFYYFKVRKYLRGCSTVVLNSLPWLYFGHEKGSLLLSWFC